VIVIVIFSKVNYVANMANIAAPLDITNFCRLEDAGYRTTSMNLEMWDKIFHKTIGP